MKIATSFMAALLLTGTLGSMSTAMSADGAISKDELTANSYCHEKFPAMTERSRDGSQPQLKQSTTGDVVDYYGPCDVDPTGKDQIATQKLEHYHQMEGSRGGEIGRF